MVFQFDFEKELEKPLFTETDLQSIAMTQPPKKESEPKSSEEVYSKVVAFTKRIKKTYGEVIKSVLIFGSAARKDAKKTSDIDVWVVLDDTVTKTSEDILSVKTNVQLIGQEMKDIHVQTNGLTEFWGWMKSGSPELFNFLRDGLVIYDTGFIKPVQRMLSMGLFPPSEETVSLKVKSCEGLIKRVEASWNADVFDLRYAATDIIQSVVMYYYKEMPDQKRIPEFMERMVKDHGLEVEYVEKFKELNKLWKDLDHKIVEKADPVYVGKADRLARDIIERMKKFLPDELKETDLPRLF